jgi:hypothetical protein
VWGQVLRVIESINNVLVVRLRAHGIPCEREPGQLISGAPVNELHAKHKDDFLRCWEVIRRGIALMQLTSMREVIQFARTVGVQEPILSSYPAIRLDLGAQPAERNFQPHREMIEDLGSSNAVAFWIPLQEVSSGAPVGTLLIGPGSHRDEIASAPGRGGLKYQVADPAYFAEALHSVSLQAGEFVLFSFQTIHASGQMSDPDGLRGSIQLRFDDQADPDYASRGWPQNFSINQR